MGSKVHLESSCRPAHHPVEHLHQPGAFKGSFMVLWPFYLAEKNHRVSIYHRYLFFNGISNDPKLLLKQLSMHDLVKSVTIVLVLVLAVLMTQSVCFSLSLSRFWMMTHAETEKKFHKYVHEFLDGFSSAMFPSYICLLSTNIHMS